jgi:hypothetical protein
VGNSLFLSPSFLPLPYQSIHLPGFGIEVDADMMYGDFSIFKPLGIASFFDLI